mgnify:CR=1 FL=1
MVNSQSGSSSCSWCAEPVSSSTGSMQCRGCGAWYHRDCAPKVDMACLKCGMSLEPEKAKKIGNNRLGEPYQPGLPQKVRNWNPVIIIGSILSLLLAIFMPNIYPEFYEMGLGAAIVGFQISMFFGVTITFVGMGILPQKPNIGFILVLAGIIFAGVNLISLCGIGSLVKEKKRATLLKGE